MSVVGIDFGNANNIVALARRKGIDVVLNDESKRETPSMVNFGDKQVCALATTTKGGPFFTSRPDFFCHTAAAAGQLFMLAARERGSREQSTT